MPRVPPHAAVADPGDLVDRLEPFLQARLGDWHGLPRISAATLRAALGEPATSEQAVLGWYPAGRWTWPLDTPSGGLAAYVRGGGHDVVAIEALRPPPFDAAEALGPPSAVMPHELLVPNAYVHEYLFCERGLVLSVSQPLTPGRPFEVVRCRGIPPLESPRQFGPELYQSADDREVW